MAKADILLVLSFAGENAPFQTGRRTDSKETHTTLALPKVFASLAQVERKGTDLADPTEASAWALALPAVQQAFPAAYSITKANASYGHIWIDGHWRQIGAADEFGFGFRVTYRNPTSGVFSPYHGTLSDEKIGYDLHVVVQSA